MACSQNEANQIGASLLGNQELAELNLITLNAASSDTSFAVGVQTGSGDYLYAGRMADLSAVTLFRFTGFEDTAPLDSAVILLNAYRVINDAQMPGSISVFTITSDWDDFTLDRDSFHEDMIGDFLGTITVPGDTVDSLYFKLDPELISQWMDTTSGMNHGLYLEADDDIMVQFFSRDISSSAATGPQLNLNYTDDSTLYPEITESAYDLFLAYSEETPDPAYLTIENGTAVRSFLEFDLTRFTPETIINRATLIMHADSLLTLPQTGEIVGITACTLDSPAVLDSLACTSANSSGGTVADGICEVELTDQIQDLISDQLDNPGFLIQGTNESSAINRLRFYSSAADSAKRPVLRIYYTASPATSF